VIFDVDGTLVDSNYQHALSWYRAFRRYDITLPLWKLHQGIGMGGDQFVGALAGDEVEQRCGDALRAAWTEEFATMLEEIAAFAGAVPLLEECRTRNLKVVLASSGKEDHVDHYLDLLDGRRLAHAWTTSQDVERTKPAPDLLQAALDKVGGGASIMVGDSTWDCKAAVRLDVATYAVRTGGFSDEELRRAGALDVFSSLEEFQDRLPHIL
jgi:HAD superfamily hydrolase (TIGR01549 family)